MQDFKDQGIGSFLTEKSLKDPWKKSFEEGRFSLFDGLIDHSSKHSPFIPITYKYHINTILYEFHGNISSGHFSEDRKMERVKDTAWWTTCKQDTSENFSTFERCHKANKALHKRFGLLMKIDEPSKPQDFFNMDWVSSVSPVGNCSYNACFVIDDWFSKTTFFIPFFNKASAIDTAILFWNRVSSGTRIPIIISPDRDPKLTSEFWTGLPMILGTKFYSSTEYHPQTNGLAERMIKKLEDIIRRFCAYGLEFKENDSFTHDWVSLLPILEIAYSTSVYPITGLNPKT